MAMLGAKFVIGGCAWLVGTSEPLRPTAIDTTKPPSMKATIAAMSAPVLNDGMYRRPPKLPWVVVVRLNAHSLDSFR
jgi:hypothetical protein